MLIMVKYPPTRKISREMLSMAKKGDVVVLIQDGVLYAIDDCIEDIKKRGVEIFAIKGDLNARGYSDDISKVKLIDYGQFVDLVVERGEKTVG